MNTVHRPRLLLPLLIGLALVASLRVRGEPVPATSDAVVSCFPAGAVGRLDGKVAVGIAYSPDGRLLATGGTSTIELWDVATSRRLDELKGHGGTVYSLAFSPDGKLLASGSADHSVRLWDVATRREVRKLGGHTFDVRCVCFSPDGKRVASGSGDHTARVWETATGDELHMFQGEGGWVYSVAFAPDAKTLAAGCMDGKIRLCDTVDGGKPRLLEGHRSCVYSVAFAPDGRLLASTGADQDVRVWEVQSARTIATLAPHSANAMYAVAYAPDGKTLAAVTHDGVVTLWETLSWQKVHVFTGVRPIMLPTLAFAPDGRTLAMPGDVFTVVFWDRTGRRGPAGLPVLTLTREQQEALWSDLGGHNAAGANKAMWDLVCAARQTLPFLAKHLKPIVFDPRISRWIDDLDDDRFAVRQQASAELARVGRQAEAALRATLRNKPSLEVRQRIELLLEKLQEGATSAEERQQARAVAVLENIAGKDAEDLLAKLAGGERGARLTSDAQSALVRLQKKAAAKPVEKKAD